jgi:hypothetical protein
LVKASGQDVRMARRQSAAALIERLSKDTSAAVELLVSGENPRRLGFYER